MDAEQEVGPLANLEGGAGSRLGAQPPVLGDRCEQAERGEEFLEEHTVSVSPLLLLLSVSLSLLLWLLSEDLSRLRRRRLVHVQP